MMIKSIVNSVANIALDYCAVKSLQLNQKEPQTREDRDAARKQRKFVSNVRNVAYIAKRVLG